MKKILIIGASSGVGKALSEYYTTQGDEVAAFSRENYDLSNIQDIQKISQHISQSDYDLIIYSAGVGYYKNFGDLSDAELQEQIFVNTLAPLEILRNGLERFQKNTTKFVYLSSIMRNISAKNMSVYAGQKQASSQVLKTIQLEYQKLDILNIDLGAIQTPMHLKAGLGEMKGCTVEQIIPKLVRAIDTKQKSMILLFRWKILVYLVFPVMKIYIFLLGFFPFAKERCLKDRKDYKK